MKDFFPVDCADSLSKIGLLVKARRLALGLRQADLKSTLGISEHTLRKIENGSEFVDLRSFMLVLWRLGINELIFGSLDGIETTSQITRHVTDEDAHQSIASKRVRLRKPKAEDF
ncbi:MAG TPA: transcriptional regulator [Pseudomonas sp.]|jgi:transcriptional regulator with XRE-family HTH domain|nr:transcriptional regulator [Pseudomonas sp.]